MRSAEPCKHLRTIERAASDPKHTSALHLRKASKQPRQLQTEGASLGGY